VKWDGRWIKDPGNWVFEKYAILTKVLFVSTGRPKLRWKVHPTLQMDRQVQTLMMMMMMMM
jgi:hypothetical protein